MDKVFAPTLCSGKDYSDNAVRPRRVQQPVSRTLRLAVCMLVLCLSLSMEAVAALSGSCSAMIRDTFIYLTGLKESREETPEHRFEVIARYPHDRTAFTQGLLIYRGYLYESTGLWGQSSVRKVAINSGHVEQSRHLPEDLFGEGLTISNDQLIQLTWKSGTGFINDPADLSQTATFNYSGEGWGSTVVDTRLVISDGSSRLRFLDPVDYHLSATLQVTEHGQAIEGLNELEYVDGLIYANVYPTDCIAQIDPHTGRVVAWVNLTGLLPVSDRVDASAVANGIAYDPQAGRLFVTGKFWPYVYELTKPIAGKQARSPVYSECNCSRLSVYGSRFFRECQHR